MPENERKVFSGQIFTVYQWDQKLYDGSTAVFERISRADTAGVLAVTPAKKIIVTRQEQPALQPFWSLLGGIVDAGESPEEAAARELLEEAGMRGVLEPWFTVEPAEKVSWKTHQFVAHDCVRVAEQSLDKGEKIEVHEVSFEPFLELAQRPDFRDKQVQLAVFSALVSAEKMKALRSLLFREQ